MPLDLQPVNESLDLQPDNESGALDLQPADESTPADQRNRFSNVIPTLGSDAELAGMERAARDYQLLAQAGVTPGAGVPGPVDKAVAWAFRPLANPQPSAEDIEFRKQHPKIGGVEEGVVDIAKGFTSPVGIATLGIGALPRAVQRTVALVFAGRMAKQTPEIARQLGDEFGKPEGERDTKKIFRLITEGAGTMGLTALAGKVGLSPERVPLQLNELSGKPGEVPAAAVEPEIKRTGLTSGAAPASEQPAGETFTPEPAQTRNAAGPATPVAEPAAIPARAGAIAPAAQEAIAAIPNSDAVVLRSAEVSPGEPIPPQPELVGMGGAVESEFSPANISDVINPVLREGMNRTGGPLATEPPTRNFLSWAANFFSGGGPGTPLPPEPPAGGGGPTAGGAGGVGGGGAAGAMRAFRGWLGTVAGKTMPKTTLRDRTSGELGGRFAASSAAAGPMGDLFVNDVLAGLKVDPAKFDAALKADNLLSVKDGFEAEAARLAAEGDSAGAARASENARQVNTLLGTRNFPFADTTQLREYFREPEVAEALRRHRENWEAAVDPMYRLAAGIDPTAELASRGRYSGARVNLNPVREGEPPAPGPRVGGAPGGNLTGTLRRRSPFARRATGRGMEYVLNYAETMANTFARQLEIANKRAFEDQLVRSGNAVIDDVGKRAILPDGDKTTSFPLIRRGFENKNIYVRQSLAEEYGAAANIMKTFLGQKTLTGANKAFAQAALAGLTDATVHVENLGTALFQVPGTSGAPLLLDAMLSGAGRLDVPLAVVRSGLKGMGEFGKTALFQNQLSKFLPEAIVNSVNRAVLKNITQMASLAEINATRAGHATRIPVARELSRTVGAADRVTRMVLDDTYRNLVREGLVRDTETNRREFVNQAGAYNLRTQGEWMRFLRQTWLSPFATAGRNFATLGVRGATLNPGVQASSLRAAALLRANMLSKWIGTAVLVGTANYLITGKLTGRPGTPIGSVDTGKNDENGKPLTFNVAAFTGQSRALRTTGLRGAIEAKRLGLPPADVAQAAFRDVANTGLGAVAGPGVRFGFTALTGQAPAVDVPRVAPRVPPGESQLLANTLAGLIHANPVVAGAYESQQPGGTLLHALASQAPRFTLSAGKPPEMVENYARIVSMAQGNEFIDDVIRRARQVPLAGEKRVKFVQEQIKRLPPEQQARAWEEMARRRVFAQPNAMERVTK